MKVLYLGNFLNKGSDSTENHIKFAFEKLGHEVIQFNEIEEDKVFTAKQVIEATRDCDLFFFHDAKANTHEDFNRLVEIITNVVCKKAFWFFDKIWQAEYGNNRDTIIRAVLPFVEYAFLTDGTWQRSNSFKNTHWLMQGIGSEDTSLGKEKEEYKTEIAFTGSAASNWLPTRKPFIEHLEHQYGDKFKIFNSVFNRDLNDLCASAKVFVAPWAPQDDFYWSSRIYMTLGSGGFLIHPYFEGLKKHFKEGVHYVGYKSMDELYTKINYYLEHDKERKKIQMAGYKECVKSHTYKHRVEKICKLIFDNKNDIKDGR